MKVSETLQLGKLKIIDPDNWYAGFVNSNDQKQDDFVKRKCHCMITAIDNTDNYYLALNYLKQGMETIDEYYPVSVAMWNDSHSHEQVMFAYDKAIEFATKDEI